MERRKELEDTLGKEIEDVKCLMVKDIRFFIATLLGLTLAVGAGGYGIGYLHCRSAHLEKDNDRLHELIQTRKEILKVQKKLLEMQKKEMQ